MPELEIINGPLEIYWAPVGESVPAIGDTPAGNWALIGTSGSKNYTEDGVTVSGEKSIEYFRSLGTPYPRKGFITQADVMVTVKVADFTLAQLRRALNENTVTSDTGFDYIELDVGVDVNEIALLLRGTGKSPALAGSNLQFELPRVVEDGSVEWSWVKGDAVGSDLSFRVIYDEGATYPVGRIVVDDTA